MTWERSQTNYLQKSKQWTDSFRLHKGDPEKREGSFKVHSGAAAVRRPLLRKIILPQRDITFRGWLWFNLLLAACETITTTSYVPSEKCSVS